MKKIQNITSVILICLFIFKFIEAEGWDDKVLLEKVRALTLYKGKYTTGRRLRPIKQIECVGGDAGCRYEPDIIQCRNIGSDGINPNWKCEAVLPKSLKFGRLKVTCEGYEHPDDQYVLKGSCGLKYTLYFTNDYADEPRKQWFSNLFDGFKVDNDKNKSFSTLFGVAWIGMIGYILYNMYLAYTRTQRGHNRTTNFRFRPSYDGTSDVPHHDFSSSSTRRAHQRENMGFWTGVLGGGLIGYLFGSRNNNDYVRTGRRRRGWGPSYFNSNNIWNNDCNDYPSHTTTSGYDDDDTYSAYGFADTDNR